MPHAFFLDRGKETWDPIEEDSSIVMRLRGKGLVVLSGCAHSGIINTVRHAMAVTGVGKVHVVMGGFHLSGPAFEAAIGPTAEELRKIGPDFVIPCHCTGRKAIMHVEQAMPGQFILNMSGTTLTFRA
jgi:7,8-dihydropterin-6-yl-methyl-4-(beta-D-ribofuranosyl)aminobenzene 5'-phosphate synthase